MSIKLSRLHLWLIIAAAVVFVVFVWQKQSHSDGDAEAFRILLIDRGDIRVAISATGSLSALSTVDVGTQVSGLVERVEVDFNDVVKKGQVIARLDPSTVKARVNQVSATLDSAQAVHAQSQANLRQADADYARKRDLVDRKLISRSDFDLAVANLDQARGQLASASANIRQQQAILDSARVDMSHTNILSPVDGVILARTVEPGQTVAASFQTPVLFKIAEDLRKMQIVLAVDEADIGQVKTGQKVTFTVDAYPDRRFEGAIEQVRLAATNTANVITYPVVVAVNNDDLALLPGMTVNAEIEVNHRDAVLRIANAALRFKPIDDTAVAMAKPRNEGLIQDLPSLAQNLKLSPAQQSEFDSALAALRERFAARVASMPPSGSSGATVFGRGPGSMSSNSSGARNAGNDGAIRQRMLERFNQQFVNFRQLLNSEQQQQWDIALAALISARRATVYILSEGMPKATIIRIGATDGSYTEVIDGLRESDGVIAGRGRSVK